MSDSEEKPPPEAAPEPVQEAPPESTQQPEPQPTEPEPEPPQQAAGERWYIRRIREQSEQLRQREAELAALRSQKPGAAPDPAAIQAQVQLAVAQQRFAEACNRTFEAGQTEFGPEFSKARDALVQAFGQELQQRPDILEAITELPQGHRVYHALAQDLDQAAEIFSLPPARAALRLAKLEEKIGKAPQRQPSKAPPPISPVSGSTTPADDLYDPKLSMADFDRIMSKRERERRAR